MEEIKKVTYLMRTVVRVLEKQIPIKPRDNYNWCDLSDDEKKESHQWRCGICWNEFDESTNYCSECGKKIDWGKQTT